MGVCGHSKDGPEVNEQVKQSNDLFIYHNKGITLNQ